MIDMMTVFLTVTTVLLIIIGVFLVRFLIELTKLTSNINDITTVVKADIEPTMSEIKTALTNINGVLKSTEKNVSSVRNLGVKTLGIFALALGGVKDIAGGFKKGLQFGMNLFKK